MFLSFLKLNADETGFYRVKYSDDFYSKFDPASDDFTEFDLIGIVRGLEKLEIFEKLREKYNN